MLKTITQRLLKDYLIYVVEDVSFSTGLCECEKSGFCEPHQKYFDRRDLKISEQPQWTKKYKF